MQQNQQNPDNSNNNANAANKNNAAENGHNPFNIDMGSWEDSPDLNLLLDAQNYANGNGNTDSPNLLNSIFSPNSMTPFGMTPMNNISHLNLNSLGNLGNLANMNMNMNMNMNVGGLSSGDPVLNSNNNNSSSNVNINALNMNGINNLSNNNSGTITNTSTNNNSNPNSPANYASQLQHYQNLLLETQNLLNLKQLQNQQMSPNNLALAKNSNNQGQNFNNNQALMQQQILQLAQAQLNNKNLIGNLNMNMNNQLNVPSSVSSPLPSNLKPKIQPAPYPKKSELPQPRTKVRPCDHCRRRKIKCVMIPDLHTCKMCQSKGIKCTFNEVASLKRNLSNSDQNSKRMKFEDPTIEPPPNIQVRDTHAIKDYSTMQGHSLLKKTLSLQYPRSSFYVGPTSIYDSLFLDKVTLDKIDQFQLNKSNSIRKVSNSVQFLLRDDFSELLYHQSESDSDTVEKYVAPHGQTLINLYFRTVHPTFPVLHKKIFLEKYARTHREFGAPLLAAVYLLAIQWWDYEPKLSNLPKPDATSLHRFAMRTFADISQRPKLSAVQAGLLLLQCQSLNVPIKSKTEESGKKSKKDNKNEKEINITEADLLINQNNWLLCTQVVALAEELGLGLDCSTWRLPKWERGLRRRLAWAVYVQDKWSSLVESRPSHIQEDINWLVRPLTDEDFPEKTNLPHNSEEKDDAFTNVDVELGKESFKFTVSLANILSEIQHQLYTPRSIEENKTIEKVLTLVKPLQLKLRNWYHSLPKILQMGSTEPKQFNANGNLQLQYFATEITLHRRIISTLYNQTLMCSQQSSQQSNTTASPQQSPLNPNFDNASRFQSDEASSIAPPPLQLVTVCRNAAKTRLTASIEFVRELKVEHMHSFWHSSAPRNFALIGIFATLLYVTSSNADEALVYRENIMDYKWILKANADKFPIAKEALALIEGVVKNIPGLWSEYDGMNIDHTNKDKKSIPSSHGFDDLSPRSVLSPNKEELKKRKKPSIRNSGSTPVNSSIPPSPLSVSTSNQGVTTKAVKLMQSMSRPRSPAMLLQQQQSQSSIQQPASTNNNTTTTATKTPTPVGTPTPTPTLLSQSRSHTPVQSSTSIPLVSARSVGGNSEHESDNKEKSAAGNNAAEKEQIKASEDSLFNFDGQQSLLNMTNMLGITRGGEGGINEIKKLNPLNNSTNDDNVKSGKGGSGAEEVDNQVSETEAGTNGMRNETSGNGKVDMTVLNHMQKMLGLGNEMGTH